MANYRRELDKHSLNLIHSIYKEHANKEGGIFTKDKRRKLLGLKQKKGKYFEDTADFWYDVRTTVRTGLKDLELFFDVADPNQIKEVLYDAPLKDQLDISKKTRDQNQLYVLGRQIPSFYRMMYSLLQKYYKTRKLKSISGQTQKYSEHIEEKEMWRAYLVNEMFTLGVTYLKEHNLISSKAHERLTDEFIDMVNVEIARGAQLSLNKRVKGYV